MFEFSLFALFWAADPAAIQPARYDVVKPFATCIRPAMIVVEPNTVCAVPSPRSLDTRSIAIWLRNWERATRNSPESSRSQREDFRRRIHEEFNEHTAAAVEQFVGHVKESRLTETYDWRIVEQTGEQVCLEAIPRDETERLFYGSLQVMLAADSGTPERLVVVSRNRSLRMVWQSEPRLEDARIHLVNFEDGVPPAPNALVRTADSRVD